mgnify:CR=1 FL=1
MADRSEKALIDDFLAQKRIAIVGVSRDKDELANALFRSLRDQGHEVVPVNPNAAELEGQPAYPNVKAIPGGADAALIMVSPSATEQAVRDCADAGVKRVWVYGIMGESSLPAEKQAAVAFCREHGIDVIPGRCPYMFIGSFMHKAHGWFLKIVDKYPK